MASAPSKPSLQVSVTNRAILAMAMPISLALLVPQLNFVTNTIFLGGLGETELGVAGITGVYYLVFALIGNGLNSGLQSLLSRRAGENRPEEMGRLYSQALWIASGFALASILLTWTVAGPLLHFSLHSDEVAEQARGFLQIRVLGIPFLYLFQLSNAFLISSGHSHYLKYGFMVEAVFNIFLDYGLIYGHFGMPRLGFNGAAIASVLAEIIAVITVLGIIRYRQLHRQFSLFSHTRYDRQRAGLYFRQSSPLILQYLLSIVAWLLFYMLIEHQGKRPLAISNTMRNIFGIFGIFVWAFASTSNAMVSNIIGQGRPDDVEPLIKRITRLSLLFTSVLCVAVNLFPGIYLQLFTRDNSFTDAAIPVIRMVTAGVLCMSVATVWLNAVTGTGNTRMNLLIEIVAIVLYSVYIIGIVEIGRFGLVWAWSSELLYWAVLLFLSWRYIRSQRWRGKII